jgi:hypothetical protein
VKKKLLIGLIVVLLAGVGLSIYRVVRLRSIPEAALRCLRTPQHMILYSIHPSREAQFEQPPPMLFHKFRVLGETDITAPDSQRVVANAIQRAVSHSFGTEYMCFDPRHGVRVTDTSGTYDFLICFECAQIYIYSGDQQTAHVTISGSPTALNDILKSAHIPLAPI